MKKVIIIFLVFISLSVFSQKEKKVKIKVDKKNNLVFADGNTIFSFETKVGLARELFSLEGESFLYIDLTCYRDYMAISDSNQKGNVCYQTLIFEGIDEKTEVANYPLKAVAKILIDHGILVEGKFNKENAIKYIKRNGRKHSAEQLK